MNYLRIREKLLESKNRTRENRIQLNTDHCIKLT